MHLTFYTIRPLIVFLKVLTMLNIFVSTGLNVCGILENESVQG